MARNRETPPAEASRAPLSAHPAFPLLVGLWFAALLGLGTIALPAALLERAASWTGLTDPPLTAATRASLALLATVGGLAGGLALARRVVEAQQAERPRRRRTSRPAGRSVRPLSVHDDLGEDAIAPNVDEARATLPGRRRALAAVDDERPSDFLLAAPLPGADTVAVPDMPADEEPMSERPSDFDAPTEPAQPADELDLADLTATAAVGEAPAPYVPHLDTRKPRDFAAPPAPRPAEEQGELVVQPIDAPLEDLGIVQLAERLGRSMQRRLAAAKLVPPAPVEPEPGEVSLPSLDQEVQTSEMPEVPPPVVPDALRAFMDTPPEELAVPPTSPPETTAVPPPVVPAALRPFAFDTLEPDEEDEDDLDPGPFTLPLAMTAPRPFEAPSYDDRAEFEQDDEEGEDSPADDDSYSSLLAMKNPFRAAGEEFVRIEEPDCDETAPEPAVVFPGRDGTGAPPSSALAAAPDAEPSAPLAAANPVRPFDAPHEAAPSTAPMRQRQVQDPLETERALRSALANLQRMSGAA